MRKFIIIVEEVFENKEGQKYPEIKTIYKQTFETSLDRPIEDIIKAVNNI